MLEDVSIKPMNESFILWRCLHRGPLSRETIDKYPPDGKVDWETRRAINVPLLRKTIKTYGTCAILAKDGDQVVGFLFFYPKILYSLKEAGGLCLQQAFPNGPSERLVETRFPLLKEIPEKTLTVRCLMTGSPFQDENPYQRKGIGTRMVRELIRWAKENGWESIETTANEDIDILYAHTGQAGRRFWGRLGFHIVKTETKPRFQGEFLKTMLEQAKVQGLIPEDVQNKYTMRIGLT